MKIINIFSKAGAFAENKDIARSIRVKELMPALKSEEQEIVLDFGQVTGATQSFVHALISDAIRKYDSDLFSRVYFKDCTESVQQVISIVADYMEAR